MILGLAMGFSDDQLANGLGVSVPTLRKYYFSVLKRRTMQRDRFELWRMETLAEQANAGNTGAIREMGKIMERRDKARLAAALAAGGKSKDPGKKAAAKEAAKQAASEGWGGLLSPGYEH
ncbi:hypothetical protein [Sagittula stellata]|nr:hypothetical protein [Sagittula stellata]